MQLIRFGPNGKLRDEIELTQQLPNHFARIFALAQLLEPFEDAGQRFLRLRDRHFRVNPRWRSRHW